MDVEDKYGKTALHVAAEKGHAAVARLLVEKGANVGAKDKDGRTALHQAAEWGHGTAVPLLLGEKGEPTSRRRTTMGRRRCAGRCGTGTKPWCGCW